MNNILYTNNSATRVQINQVNFDEITNHKTIKLRNKGNSDGKFLFEIRTQSQQLEYSIVSICRKIHHDRCISTWSSFPCESLLTDGMIIQIASTFDSNRLIVELTRQLKGYERHYTTEFVDMFAEKIKMSFMNLCLKLNPATNVMRFNDLDCVLKEMVASTLSNSMESELMKTTNEMFQFFVTFCNQPIKDFEILEFVLEFMAGDKVKSQLVANNPWDWTWCGVFMWKLLKIAINCSSFKGNFKTYLAPLLNDEMLSPMVKHMTEDKPNDANLDTLGCEVHVSQFVEFSATINDLTTQNMTSHISKFKVHKVKYHNIQGKSCRLKNGLLELNNESSWFAPPVQPIHISICNAIQAEEIDSSEQVNSVIEMMVINNCIRHCYSMTDFFILLQTCETLTFNSESKVSRRKLIQELISSIKYYDSSFNYEEDEFNDTIVNILINILFKKIFESCSSNESMIRCDFKLVNCQICGNTINWPMVLTSQLDDSNNLLLTIKRKDSHFLMNISIKSLREQISKCMLIGSDPGATRRKHKDLSKLNAEQIELIRIARATTIDNDFRSWCAKFKKLDLKVTNANIVAYTKKGTILVDGKVSISTNVYIQNSIEIIKLLNDDTLNIYDVACSSSIPKGVRVENLNENSKTEMESFKSLLFYHKDLKKGYILPITEVEFEFPNSHWNKMNRLKYKFKFDYEVTQPIELELNGRKCSISFLYNKDHSAIQCFIPKHLVDYLYVERNQGEYYEVIRSKSEPPKYRRIDVFIAGSGQQKLVYYGSQRINPLKCEGDYAEVSWFKMLNSETSQDPLVQAIRSKLLNWMHELMNGDVIPMNLPEDITRPNQIMPIIAVLDKETVECNLNSNYLTNYITQRMENCGEPIKIESFCRCLDWNGVLCASVCGTMYLLNKGGLIKTNGINYRCEEFLKLVNEQFVKVNSKQLNQLQINKEEDMIKLTTEYMKYNTLHNSSFISVNSIEISNWSCVRLIICPLNASTPSLTFNNQIALNRTWSSNNFVEIKSTSPIKWELNNGVLQLPTEISHEFPEFSSAVLNSQRDWYLKLHTFVELFLMHVLKSQGHKVKIEFTTEEGNERDILVDDQHIIEVKTQTMFNRALDSFLEKTKHIGEELVAATRHSVFVTKNCWDKLLKDKSDQIQLLANLVTGYNEMRDSNGRIVQNLFERSNFPHKIDQVLPIKTPIKHDYVTEVNKGKIPNYTKKLEQVLKHKEEPFQPDENSVNFKNSIIKEEVFERICNNEAQMKDVQKKIDELEEEIETLSGKYDKIYVEYEALNKAAEQVEEMINEGMDECMTFTTVDGVEIKGVDLNEEFVQLNAMAMDKLQAVEQIESQYAKLESGMNALNATAAKLKQESIEVMQANKQAEIEFEGFKGEVTFNCSNVSHETLRKRTLEIGKDQLKMNSELNCYQLRTQAKVTVEEMAYDFTDQVNQAKFIHSLPSTVDVIARFKPLIVNLDQITLEATRISQTHKRLIAKDHQLNSTFSIKYEDKCKSIISFQGFFNCLDVCLLCYMHQFMLNQRIKPGGSIPHITVKMITKDEHFNTIDHVKCKIGEFVSEIRKSKGEFLTLPSTSGVILSVTNIEAEIRRALDLVMNNFANQVQIAGWQRGRVRFAKNVIAVLFDQFNCSQLYNQQNDSMHKCVSSMVSFLNSSRQMELPEDVCHQVATVSFSSTPKTVKLAQNEVKGRDYKTNDATVPMPNHNQTVVNFSIGSDFLDFKF